MVHIIQLIPGVVEVLKGAINAVYYFSSIDREEFAAKNAGA